MSKNYECFIILFTYLIINSYKFVCLLINLFLLTCNCICQVCGKTIKYIYIIYGYFITSKKFDIPYQLKSH